jgi:DNA mismatch endonuclease (patch repair protein)
VSESRKAYGILKLRETWVVSENTRKSMQGNRSTGTKPEERLRKALWAAGLKGYRKNVRKLPGTPDIVFHKHKLAVFVHGCFWHGCPTCTRNRTPATNSAYWAEKLKGNRERDDRNKAKLEELGWRVLVLWECEVEPKRLEEAVEMVRQALQARELF